MWLCCIGLSVGDVRQSGRVCFLPGTQPVVEHHPRTAERPGQCRALARRGVETVVVPEPHPLSIVGFMTEHGDIRTGRHCVFVLHAHLVFVTKYRHPVFAARHLDRMGEIMRDVCADFRAELAEFNGEPGHVHLLVNFPPTMAISRLVNSLKGVSSRRMRQEFPDLARHYWRANRLWSGSYFAGSAGGAPTPSCASTLSSRNVPLDRPTSSCLHHRPEDRRTSGHIW